MNMATAKVEKQSVFSPPKPAMTGARFFRRFRPARFFAHVFALAMLAAPFAAQAQTFGDKTVTSGRDSIHIEWTWNGDEPDYFEVRVQAEWEYNLQIRGYYQYTSAIPPVSWASVANSQLGPSDLRKRWVRVEKHIREFRAVPLTPGLSYRLEYRGCVNSAEHDEFCYSTSSEHNLVPGIPFKPTALESSGKKDGFRLGWTKSGDNGFALTGHQVRYKEVTAEDPNPDLTSGATTAWFGADAHAAFTAETHGIILGKSYDLQVRARNIQGVSGWSDTVRATAEKNSAPPKFAAPAIDNTGALRSLQVGWGGDFDVAGKHGAKPGGIQIRWAAKSEPNTFINEGGANGRTVGQLVSFTIENMRVDDYLVQVRPFHEDAEDTEWSDAAEARPRGSTVNTLSQLSLSDGRWPLRPGFAANNMAYTATVGAGVTAVTLRAAPTHSVAAMRAGGEALQTGIAKEIAVGEKGTVTGISVEVTPEDGAPLTTYNIAVTRPDASDDAKLSALSLSHGTLSPAFSADTTTYAATVAGTVTGVRVTPTLNAPNLATLHVSGRALASGAQSLRQALSPTTTTTDILIVVTAEDGVTTKTYTVTVTRPAPGRSSDATLLSAVFRGAGGEALAMKPAFSASVTSYYLAVPSTTARFTATASATHPAARMRYAYTSADAVGLGTRALADEGTTGVLDLKRFVTAGIRLVENQFQITVTPEDTSATARVYKFTLVRGEGAPSAPRITRTLERTRGVALQWEAPAAGAIGSDISGYRYRWSNDADPGWESAGGADGAVIPDSADLLQFTLTGLAGNTAHTLQLAAENASGTGAWSESVSFRPLAVQSGEPTAITLREAHNELRLSWGAPGAGTPTEYKVRWARGAGSTNWINTGNAAGVSAGAARQYTITQLGRNSEYEVQVGARVGSTVTWSGSVSGRPRAPRDISCAEFCDENNVNTLRTCTRPLAITPAFDEQTFSAYSVFAPFESDVIRIRSCTSSGASFVAEHDGGSITAGSGVYAAGTLTLQVGAPREIRLKASGAAEDAYTFTLTRGTDSRLSALAVSPGELKPAFDPSQLEYTVDLAYNVSSVTVTPSISTAGLRLRVEGAAHASGRASPSFPLEIGQPRTIAISVAGADNTRVYRVTVTRVPLPDLRFTANAPAQTVVNSGAAISPIVFSEVVESSGTPPFRYVLLREGGGLPAGLRFTENTRTLSGTPRLASGSVTYTLNYIATDSGNPRLTGAQATQLVVSTPLVFTEAAPAELLFTYAVAGSAALPAVSGGVGNYAYELRGESLPPGLTFDANTRALSGAPERSVTRAISYRARDAGGSVARADISLRVRAARAAKPNVRAAGANASIQLNWLEPSIAEAGGEAPSGYRLRWAKSAASTAYLNSGGASGAEVKTTSHTITGLDNGDEYRVEVAAVNGAGAGAWSDPVTATPSASALSFVSQQADMFLEANVLHLALDLPVAQGGTTPYVYSMSALPSGLDFTASPSPPDIGNTPNTPGAFPVTYTVTDAAGASVSQRFTINVIAKFGLNVDADTPQSRVFSATVQDGILIARYLMGVRGAALVAGQSGAVPSDLAAYIQTMVDAGAADVDGDGDSDGIDGILIARHLIGLRGDALVKDMEDARAFVVERNIARKFKNL